MKTFDLLTVALLAAALVVALGRSTRSRTWAVVLLLGAVVSCAVHIGVERSRWQMWPAYLVLCAAVLVAAAVYWRRLGDRFAERRRTQIALVMSGVLVLSLSVLASWAFPMFELPRPSGPFAVGTTQFHFVDASRPEPHTANPIDVRELMVRVWYPATIEAGSQPAPYMPNMRQVSRALNEDQWPYGVMLSHLGQIPTHSVIDAPLSKLAGPYPVLVFSHGLGMGWAGQNTVLLEELASRGYVIFAIDHTYDGLASVLPDGRVATFIAEAYESHDAEPSAELTRDAERLMNSQDSRELLEIMERILREQPQEAQLSRFWNDVWSRDQRFVIDQIEKLQSAQLPSMFAGHLQLDRLGVFGMSFGGSSSAVTCAADTRCKAGINLDGFRAVAIETPPQRSPFMYFANARLSVNSIFLDRDLNDRYFVKVRDSDHLDFMDAPLISPLLKLVDASGPIDAQHMASLTTAYVSAFFDRYLMGEPAVLLNGPSAEYPEVQLEMRTVVDGKKT